MIAPISRYDSWKLQSPYERKMDVKNQCDGCNLGLPIDEDGNHFDPTKEGYDRLHMGCTKDLYGDQDDEN